MSDALAAAAAADLAVIREELRAAAHTLALVQIGGEDERAEPGLQLLTARRREIELRVAELRLALWSEEKARAERTLRSLGIRP